MPMPTTPTVTTMVGQHQPEEETPTEPVASVVGGGRATVWRQELTGETVNDSQDDRPPGRSSAYRGSPGRPEGAGGGASGSGGTGGSGGGGGAEQVNDAVRSRPAGAEAAPPATRPFVPVVSDSDPGAARPSLSAGAGSASGTGTGTSTGTGTGTDDSSASPFFKRQTSASAGRGNDDVPDAAAGGPGRPGVPGVPDVPGRSGHVTPTPVAVPNAVPAPPRGVEAAAKGGRPPAAAGGGAASGGRGAGAGARGVGREAKPAPVDSPTRVNPTASPAGVPPSGPPSTADDGATRAAPVAPTTAADNSRPAPGSVAPLPPVESYPSGHETRTRFRWCGSRETSCAAVRPTSDAPSTSGHGRRQPTTRPASDADEVRDR